MADYNLGTAQGRIEIDSSGATRGITSAQRAVTGFTGQASRSSRVLGFLGRGMVALGAATAGVVGFGVKLASDMQQAEIAFEQFLGSAEKGRAFLEELQQFAATTPFEFPQLRTAAQSLLSIGVEAEKVIPIMTTLGDVTSGMGTGAEGVARATRAIQQMIAANRILAEDLNQLRDAGIPVYDLLSAALDEPIDKVAEMARTGELGADALEAVMRALETGEGLEQFTGLMEKQSQTLAGLFSTLKDTVGLALVDIAQPLVQGLTEAMPQLSKTIETTMRAIGPAFADVLQQVLNLVAEILPAVTPILKALGKGFANTLEGLIPLFKALEPLGVALGRAFAIMLNQGIVPLLPMLVDLANRIVPVLIDVLEILEPLLPAIAQGWLAWKFALQPLGGLITGVTGRLGAMTAASKAGGGGLGALTGGANRVAVGLGLAAAAAYGMIEAGNFLSQQINGHQIPTMEILASKLLDTEEGAAAVAKIVGDSLAKSLLESSEAERLWAASLSQANEMTRKQRTNIAALLNGLTEYDIELTDSQKFTIDNYIATGNYSGALKLLQGHLTNATRGLRNMAPPAERAAEAEADLAQRTQSANAALNNQAGAANSALAGLQNYLPYATRAAEAAADLAQRVQYANSQLASTPSGPGGANPVDAPNPVAPPHGVHSDGGGHSGSHVDNRHLGPASVPGATAVVVDIDGVAVTQMVRMHSDRMRVRLGGRR